MTTPSRTIVIASYVLFAALSLYVLCFHMVGAALFGTLVWLAVARLSTQVFSRAGPTAAKSIAVGLIAGLVVLAFALVVFGIHHLLRDGSDSLSALLDRLSGILDQANAMAPPFIRDNMPQSIDALRQLFSNYLHANSTTLTNVGKESAVHVVHILIAMIIGAMLAFHKQDASADTLPLATALQNRFQHYAQSFRSIVFAQAKISAINTAFTALYLLVILPLSGHALPFSKTMIAVTFLVGMLPVVGNLISNSLIVLLSLGNALGTAIASLVFLLVIHKLEYFINARVIGARINAAAWELLLAMLIMETLFGLPGIVIAPILYAYIKLELRDQRLI